MFKKWQSLDFKNMLIEIDFFFFKNTDKHVRNRVGIYLHNNAKKYSKLNDVEEMALDYVAIRVIKGQYELACQIFNTVPIQFSPLVILYCSHSNKRRKLKSPRHLQFLLFFLNKSQFLYLRTSVFYL